jgi:putative acetyltransferase
VRKDELLESECSALEYDHRPRVEPDLSDLNVQDITAESPDQPDVVALLAASDGYMAELYAAESNHMLDVGALKEPDVTFLVARLDGRAVGCGAVVRSGEDWAEIKRMFVSPEARGRSLGRRLLQKLEDIAVMQGAALLRLETGVKQLEALALYRSVGFVEIGPFGSYGPDPCSVFMEKRVCDEKK